MADTTLQDLSNKLDHIAELTLIGSKTVLNIEEAALFTGLSVGHIYRLTSGKKIPHFKKQRKLYLCGNGYDPCAGGCRHQRQARGKRLERYWFDRTGY